MRATHNTLSENVRTQAAEILNRRLAAAIDLHGQLKQAHWNVRGPTFIAVHELFDKVAGEAESLFRLAGRTRRGLGAVAEGTVQVAAGAFLPRALSAAHRRREGAPIRSCGYAQLIVVDAPIEISGFALDEIDQIVLAGRGRSTVETGPLEPDARRGRCRPAGRRLPLGPHRLICGDATRSGHVLGRLMEGDPPARLILTDEPYNVQIAATSPAATIASSRWPPAR